MRFYFLLISVFCSNVCFAQVEGLVSDAKNDESLPFTHVLNLNTSKTAVSDINGFFRIEAKSGDALQFSSIGYIHQVITVGDSTKISVKLHSDQYSLSEIEVRPGVNPAHRIINNAIARRFANNPDNREAYSCVIYNRLTVDVTEPRVTSCVL